MFAFTDADVVILVGKLGCMIYAPIIVASFWLWIARREVKLLHAKEQRDGRV